jgi:uncharacterized membrane protein
MMTDLNHILRLRRGVGYRAIISKNIFQTVAETIQHIDGLLLPRTDQTMAAIVKHAESRVASVAGPIYLLLFPIPVVCFLAALITDIAYSASAFLMWLHFSQWLIAAGVAFGVLAALVLLVEFFASGTIRTGKFGWAHLALFYAALIVALFNAFVHSIDGWTAVVPTGMILSISGAILALAAVGALFFVPVTWVEVRGARP